jgi:hypothetical protein
MEWQRAEPTNQAYSATSFELSDAGAGAVTVRRLNENDLYCKGVRMVRSLSVTAQDDNNFEIEDLQAAKRSRKTGTWRIHSETTAMRRHLQALHEAEPNDATYLTEVSFSHKHLGAVLAVRKQYAAALEQYQAARAIDEKRIAADPQNLDYRYAVTFDYSDIGPSSASKGCRPGAGVLLQVARNPFSHGGGGSTTPGRAGNGYVLTSIGNSLSKKNTPRRSGLSKITDPERGAGRAWRAIHCCDTTWP